ncbi:MAG: hypothetical protein GC192_14720 [Bacteroidetes bacterium]|nr:hypothetical protein [Bacteroidota bacterium]
MRYLLFPLSALFLLPVFLKSQTIQDATRYSMLEVTGTARSAGLGGGLGALGADFSVLSTNPAGLATFRRSEFTFTPSFTNTTNESLLEGLNATNSETKTNFNFNNIGLIISSKPLSTSWTNTAFGVGLNRLGNYNQRAYYEGTSFGSITDRWVDLANGLTPNELGFEEGLAYDAEAIYNPDENDPTYYLNDFDPNESVWRSQNIKRRGGYSELVLSYAGNYKERLMIGATMGIPFVNYEENKTYVESDKAGTNPVFNELTYTENLKTTGAGINLKVGAILRLNQMVRIGLAVHTPTGLALKDNYSSKLDYSYTLDGIAYSSPQESPDGNFEYRIRTPMRVIGSAGLLFSKSGFLTAEVEYLDYTKAKFIFNNSADGGDKAYEGELNQQINDKLTSAVNIRVGGEYALDKFRFRGGYSILKSPYSEGFDPAGTLSLGAGAWWSENFFMDIAYRHQMSSGQYSPYLYRGEPAQIITQDITRDQFLLTFGFKF